MFKTKKSYSTSFPVTMLFAAEDDAAATAEAARIASETAAETAASEKQQRDAATAEAAREAEFQRRVEAAVNAQTKGLKDKNNELLGTLKSTKESLKKFDGLDADKARELINNLENDEDTKLWNDGKKDVVIAKYTERERIKFEAQVESERQARVAAEQVRDGYKIHVLDNQIRSVANGLHPGAVEDALLHARQIFQLDAKGNAVKLGPDGNPEVDADGKPYTPAQWIESQKTTKPHWFPMSTSGSGGSGAREGSGTGNTIKRAEFAKLSPLEQGTAVRAGSKIVD